MEEEEVGGATTNGYLPLKRICFNLNADVCASALNKELVKHCASSDDKKKKARVDRCVPQGEQAAESLQGTEIQTHGDAARTPARSAEVNHLLVLSRLYITEAGCQCGQGSAKSTDGSSACMRRAQRRHSGGFREE